MKKHLTLTANLFLVKKIFEYNRLLFVLRIAVAVLSSVSTLASILMPMYVLDAIISGSVSEIVGVVAIFTAVILLVLLIQTAFSAYDKVKSERMYVYVINELLQKAINLDLCFFDNAENYDKYSRAFVNCCNVINSINSIISGFVTSIFNIIFIIRLLTWMDTFMFFIITLSIIINLVVNNHIKKVDYIFNRDATEKNKQVNYLYRLFYIPRLIREVKTSNLSSYILRLKTKFNERIIDLVKDNLIKKIPARFLINSLNTIESSFVAVYL